MFCKFCGKEIPDGSAFCKHCGKKLINTEAPRAETQPPSNTTNKTETNTNNQAVNTAVQSTPTMSKKKKGVIRGCIAGVVAIIIVVVVAFNIYSSTIPTSAVENSIKQSETFTKGFVSDNYTNASAYSLSDIEITKTTDGIDSSSTTKSISSLTGKEYKTVEFKGKMKNDSFESEFSGKVVFNKSNNGWEVASSPTKTSSTTKPLKGVDKFDTTSKSTSSLTLSSSDVTRSYDNFNVNFDDNGGTYSCTATQECKIEYWFGTDTATVKQKFNFNPEKGWETSGNQEIENQKTQYSLAGKTFDYTSSTSSNDSLSLNFKQTENTETPQAEYTITHSLGASSSKGAKAVNLTGTATGNIKRTFGEDSFKIELNDSSQGVTFSGSSSSQKEVAGVGKCNTMGLSVKTNALVYEGTLGTSTFSLSYGTFVESKKV